MTGEMQEREREYHNEVKPFLKYGFDPNSFRAIIERHERIVDSEFSQEVLNPTTELGQLRYLFGKLRNGYGLND
jgi:hypothetical protein